MAITGTRQVKNPIPGALAAMKNKMATPEQEAEKQRAGLTPAGPDSGLAGREDLLKQQFAAARKRLGTQKTQTERQSRLGMEQLAARTGQVGGAIQKAQQQAIRDIGQQFGDVEATLAGEEASALAGLREAERAREFQSEESRRARETQFEQFKQTLEFQKGSFADQMAFQWAEFDENLKTNFINAAMALKEAGLGLPEAWRNLFEATRPIYGSRVPEEFSPDVRTPSEAARRASTESSRRGADWARIMS